MNSDEKNTNNNLNKCVLLYSGGLDTSCCIKWIKEKYGYEVIALILDVGQKSKDFKMIKQRALKIGAKDAILVDAKNEFANEYISKAIKANALYEGVYPMSAALSRPLIAKWAVNVAIKNDAQAIAHGCTGKGNDQVRFDVTINTLYPKIKIIAPVREWNMSREEEIEYAKSRDIPLELDTNSIYSVDENVWGRSSECGPLEYPEKEPPKDLYGWITYPENAPDKSETLSLKFKKGIPVELNNEKIELYEIISKLNEIAGKHGVGIIDHMEDRIIGLKSREIYEAPAATVIMTAHKDLEKFVCTINENLFKPIIDNKWTELAYSGLWLDPLMTSLESFINKINEKVEGEVILKIYKGSVRVIGRSSKNALYNLKLATYDKGQTFNQNAAEGFIELYGLQTKMANNLK